MDKLILDCAGKPLDLSRTSVMGILNVTPDSFSDGGQFDTVERAVAHAVQMVEEGAAIIDIGGESTRPGAAPVSTDDELARVIPVIEALHDSVDVPVSIDTRKPDVMRAAVAAGAGMVNDVGALRADGAIDAVADSGVPVCLMHMQGEPGNMQDNPAYDDVVGEVRAFLLARAHACEAGGIAKHRILLDPGFGFGKRVEHNLQLLRDLQALTAADYPVLVGLSRKSMIGKVLDLPVDKRLQPGIALAVLAAWQGARVVRTHDVRETREALDMCAAVMHASGSCEPRDAG